MNEKEFYESDNEGSPSRKRHRSGLNADMEQCLYLWFANARSRNVPVTDEILKKKAKHFGDETGVTDFKCSNGWLQRFKARHGISLHIISGERTGVDRALIDTGRKEAIRCNFG